MNWTKREMLMQRLPEAADILALVPITGAGGGNETVIHTAAGDCLTLHAATEYVLSCLAGREDKELRLIRRNAARQLARRRNIILPILHGCVLAPIMVRYVQKRLGRLGYINIARTPLIARGAHGTDLALQSGTVIHTLWQPPTVRKLMQEGRAVHYKLLLAVKRQLESAAEYA